MPWTYQMGRMQPADAAGLHCDEPNCPHRFEKHGAVYRVDATSQTGEIRRRNVCLIVAPAMAARIKHPFPPGLWS